MLLGGGCRGRALAAGLLLDGHAVRATTRSESGRGAIERLGAECWVGDPARLATLRGALDGVAVACWLLGCARGTEQQLHELHTSRLEFFLSQAIDTTVRGFLYEARGGSTPAGALAAGERTVERVSALNAIPARFLRADPADPHAWARAARAEIDALLDRR